MNNKIYISVIIALIIVITLLTIAKQKERVVVKKQVITKQIKIKVPVSKISKAKLTEWIYHNSFRCSKQQAKQYASIILQLEHPLLIASIIKNESSFNVTAYSNTKAIGLMQIMPTPQHLKQLKDAGIIKNVRDLFNPDTNINAGVFIFNDILKINKGDILSALRMYSGSKIYSKRVLETLGQLTIEVKGE